MSSGRNPIAALVEQIDDAALGVVPWETALQSLATLFGANSAALCVELKRGGGWGASIGAADPSFHASYFSHYAAINPLTARCLTAPVGAVLTEWMLMPGADYRRSEFFNDWAGPQDFDTMMHLRLHNGDDAKIGLGLTRSSRAGAFEHDDVALQRRLAPHFRRGLRVHMRLAEALASGHAMGAALDRMRRGVIGVDKAGRIVFANQAARSLLGTRDGLQVACGVLAAGRPDRTAALRHMIAAAALGHPAKALTLPRSDGRSALLIEALPVGRSAAPLGLGSPPAVLLMVTDPENDPDATTAVLQDLYGLTAREAAVAVRAARGDGLDNVADTLGMAPNTARSHLKKVFDKTDTHRQAELAWLVARLSA